ncbi:MAG: EVE domain-containing protein [Eikenella corrodens]|uniref:EVE domain-containing protein n=1 Tax=Eikenella corrodens TaxID=539 RepID=UPI00360926A6
MKYWIGTVSKEHVLRGVAGGFCQVCHGKAAPLNRMQRGDWLLYYSPKIRLDGHDKLQSFTALGQITDDQAYPFQMSASFIPFRRNVAYAEIRRECPIAVIHWGSDIFCIGR